MLKGGMVMNNYSARSSKFQSITTYIVFAFFLFTTFFSGIPGIPVAPPKAHATTGEITYVTDYTYDDNSNVKSRTAPNGNVIKSNYDGLYRLIEKCYLNDIAIACTTANADVIYDYDANGNRTSMTDSTGTTSYTYDRFNRLTSVAQPGIVPTYYEYDKANNLTKITYPTGEEIVYGYDNDNRLTSVEDNTGTTSYAYDDLTNDLIKKTLPDGVYTDYTYDTAHRITDVDNMRSDDTLISSYHYTFDANNNRTQVIETTQSGTKTVDYIYDDLNRLERADYTDGSFEIYTYDDSGNRLTKTTQAGTTTYVYDGDNRLISDGNNIFFYDDSGNLSRKMTPNKTIDYTYNNENRLTQYTDGTDTIDFTYDGDGNRVTKTINGVMTKYINDVSSPISQVLIETTAQNNVTNRYTYGFSRINQVSDSESFFLYNRLGRSVSSVISGSGQILNDYEYDSFGNIKTANETVTNNFKYTGEQYDEETGLIYLRNRYYDPEVGRFITKDPFPGYVSAPQTVNPYPYVGNNPVNQIDPSGLCFGACIAAGIIGGAVLGAAGAKLSAYLVEGLNDLVGDASEADMNNMHQSVNSAIEQTLIINTAVAVTAATAAAASNPITIGNAVQFTINATPNTPYSPITTIYDAAGKVASVVIGKYSDAIIQGAKDVANYVEKTFASPSYGGVSLSTTATFMGDINDIEGVAYDEFTGQIILYGKTDASLPPMDLDDLAVAVRSIYGYGSQNPQDPGVSIGTESSSESGYMKVRYDGQTFDTNFGYVMYEADRVLKSYTLGKDNVTGSDISSGVSGYSSLLNRAKTAIMNGDYYPQGSVNTRMWFVPKQISLKIQDNVDQSPSMVFDSVNMEVLTESKFASNVTSMSWAEAFATHFTNNYDSFANEKPILKELKTLGKITSVVKWIKDNDIPFDLSYFENYTPTQLTPCYLHPVPSILCTPEYTPQTTSHTGAFYAYPWRTVYWDYTMTGGVTYSLDKGQNYFETPDAGTNQVKQDAVNARGDETNFTWDFTSGGQTYKAVAHSLSRSQKDGNIKKAFLDMSFPVEGSNSLSLVRYYNSFNDKSTGFGLGWDIAPYKLRFPSDKWFLSFGNQSVTVYAYPQIFINENGSEHLYSLSGLDVNMKPVYIRNGGKHYLKENTDETYTLYTKNKGTVTFDPGGKLIKVTDINGIYIDYNYNGANLTSIAHQGGRTITLTYNANNEIDSAVGPVTGGKTITYTYNAHGDLETSYNEDGETVKYYYDGDYRLNKIIDPMDNIVFQAGLDDYNRATTQTIGSSASYSTDFDLSNRMSTVTNPNNVITDQHFDALYRLTTWSDTEGRQGSITYDPLDFGPETVTDSYGNTSVYGYDSAGNVNYIKDAKGGERRFAYDLNNNLVIARDALNNDTVYLYDTMNRLDKILHDASAVTDVNQELTGTYSYDTNNVTSYAYNQTNGNLESITDPEGRIKNLYYEVNGLVEKVTYPSGYWTGYQYDSRSRLERVYDAQGDITTYTYDGADRVKTTTATAVGTETNTYDLNGNLDKFYDANNGYLDSAVFTYDYDYDVNNNLTKVTDAEGGVTDYVYDTVNNLLKSITLPNGTIKEIGYDALNRPITVTYRIPNPVSNPSVIVDTLDMGSALINDSSIKYLTVCNTGNAEVNITNVFTDNTDFIVTTSTGQILPGECFDIEVTFNAVADTTGTAILTIEFDNAPSITVDLSAALILDPLALNAVSGLNGIDLTWDEFTGPGTFDHYNVYRSTSEITDISGLTPISTYYNAATDLTHPDENVTVGTEYHYSVVAFNVGSNQITGIHSLGPITFLNMGNVGAKIDVAQTGQDEKAVAIAYNTNSSNKEYLMVYQYDASGNGTNYDIYGRIVSGDGQMGTAFPIMNLPEHEKNPEVAYNSIDNEYMVVAEHYSVGAGHYQIRAQRVSANGSIIGSPIDIYYTDFGQYSSEEEHSPTIAYNSNVNYNQYFVGYASDHDIDDTNDEFVRFLLNSSGTPIYYNYANGSLDFKTPKVVYDPAANQYFSVFIYTNNIDSYSLYSLTIDSNGDGIASNNALGSSAEFSNPNVTYNSDSGKCAATFQFDYYNNGSEYHVYMTEFNTDGTLYDYKDINSYFTGYNFMWPDLAYFDSQNEYLLTFTHLDGTDYDVQALRVPADTLNVTDITNETIAISFSDTNAEQASRVVYNDDLQEFLVAYEYDNGSDWDVKAQRVGNVTQNLDIVPDSLDFGTDLAQQDTHVSRNTGENSIYLTNTTDQPWLSVSPYLFYSGSVSEKTLTVSIDRSGLAVGSYSGNVLINSSGIMHTVPATMEVVNVAPDAPSNPSPTNGATDQADLGTTLTVTMSWTGSDPNTNDLLTYDVYFDENPNPSTLVSDDQTADSYQSAMLKYETTYYWRVEAKDEAGLTTQGPIWRFTTIKIPAPALTPVANPTNNMRPAFSWSPVQGALNYHIQIDDDSGFSNPLIVDDNTLITADYTLSSDLPEGTIYWRVASIDINSNGNFSAADNFLIDITPLGIPVLTAYTPDPTNDKTPTLSWSAVTGAANYHIQISENAGFTAPLTADKYVSNTSYTHASDLTVDIDKDIYWRVSSIDGASNESAFSGPDSFRLDVTAPAQIIDLVASHADTNVTLIWSFSDLDSDFNNFNIYRSNSSIDNVSGVGTISTSIVDPATNQYIDQGAASTLYFYAITAVDNAGNENKDVIDISNTSPTPGFTANPVAGDVPLTVDFYSTSTGYDLPLTYMWDIDNNGTTDSTNQDTSYTYNQIGLYSVKLTVTDYDNDPSSLIKNDYISVCSPDYIRIPRTTPVYYSTILDAYNAVASLETIEMTADSFAESLTLTRDVSITMNGGYECTLTNDTGLTVINGELRISNGTVKLSNIRISP